MQIFEITQRKKVNEGALSALAGGVAKSLGNKFVQSQTGQQMTEPAKAGANARMGAFTANQQIVGPLAKQMQVAWGKAVQEFMSRSKDANGAPVTKLSDLSAASFGTLEPQLVAMVNNAIRTRDYKADLQHAANSGDPTVKGAAQAAQEAIDKGIKAIMAASVNPQVNAQAANEMWQELVRDGVAPAQQIAQFDAGKAGGQAQTGGRTQAGQPLQVQNTPQGIMINGLPLVTALKNPAVKQMWDTMQQQAGAKP